MGIPDTVRKRQFPATGKWEAEQVFDSNRERDVWGVVDPRGNLNHVYGDYDCFWAALEDADRRNNPHAYLEDD